MQLGAGRLFRGRKRAGRADGTTRREGVGFVEAVETRGKLLLAPAMWVDKADSQKWLSHWSTAHRPAGRQKWLCHWARKMEGSQARHVRIDDIAGAEWFGRSAGQPAGDDGHRNGYLLRDAHSSAAAAAEEAAGDAVGAEGGRQSGHQWRHLWSY